MSATDENIRARAVATLLLRAADPVLAEQIRHELLHDDPPTQRQPVLTAVLCDDWLIYARDRNGNAYYISTELWSDWLNCQPGADSDPKAIEHHMLPAAWSRGYFSHPEWWHRVEPQFEHEIPTEPLGGVPFWDVEAYAHTLEIG